MTIDLSLKKYKIYTLQKEYIKISEILYNIQIHINNIYKKFMIDSIEYNAIFTKLYDVVRTINKKHNCYVIDECTSDIDNDLTTDEDITIDLDLECFSNGQDNYEEVTIFNKIYNISKSINLHHSNLLPDKIKNIKPLEDEWIILIDIFKRIGYVDINEAEYGQQADVDGDCRNA